MNSLVLILALTMSTHMTFENTDRSALTPEQIFTARTICAEHELERIVVEENAAGVRSIRCYSLTDPEIDLIS